MVIFAKIIDRKLADDDEDECCGEHEKHEHGHQEMEKGHHEHGEHEMDEDSHQH
jgi:hypothetical protein